MKFTKQTDHVARLDEWSGNVLDVFTSTVNKLSTINDEIDTHHAAKHEQKTKLEQEMQQLQNIKTRNAAVVSKIQGILN